jgi:hypothetical protein
MFSNIDDQIQQTNGQPLSRTQQLLRALGVFGPGSPSPDGSSSRGAG